MCKIYGVNEIFYSLQGEGYWTGTPIVFLRFAGCNLACPFCDTDFRHSVPMSADQIIEEITKLSSDCRRICITGGEPSLQLDKELTDKLHEHGWFIHIETNGTHALPEGVDWITLSPKSDFVPDAKVVLPRADELKLVYTGQDPSPWLGFPATWHFLQPCSCSNTAEVTAYIKAHPDWRMSLQTHKYLSIR